MPTSHRRPRTLIAGVDAAGQRTLARQFAVFDLGAAEICASVQQAPELVRADPTRFDVVLLRLHPPTTASQEVLRQLARLDYQGQILLAGDGTPCRLQAALATARSHGLRVLGSISSPEALSRLRALYARLDPRQACQAGNGPGTYLAGRLRTAIAAGELCSHYQPKVMFDSGRVVGVEALARWQHPDEGLLPPQAILPLAEAEQLTAPLARTLLREQLRDLRGWLGAGIEMSLAFNTTGTDLAAADLPDLIADDAEAEQGPRLRLICEVSEARVGEAMHTLRTAAARLRDQHVGLAIDNYGGGDATPARLRELPLEELKIDRAFVHGAAQDPSLRAIVETGLRVARELGVRAVAEGIEDRADWDLLRGLGCDAAQGFFIAPPLPADAIPGWIAQWQQRSRDLSRPERVLC